MSNLTRGRWSTVTFVPSLDGRQVKTGDRVRLYDGTVARVSGFDGMAVIFRDHDAVHHAGLRELLPANAPANDYRIRGTNHDANRPSNSLSFRGVTSDEMP